MSLPSRPRSLRSASGAGVAPGPGGEGAAAPPAPRPWRTLAAALWPAACALGLGCAGPTAPEPPAPATGLDLHLGLADGEHEADRERAIGWLLAHGDEVEPVLRARVAAGLDPDPRLELQLLAELGRVESLPAMEAALARGRPGEALAAAGALAAHPAPAARAALLAAAAHPDPRVRGAVASAAGAAGHDWACPALRAGVEDPDADVAFFMVRGAWRAGCLDAEALRRLAAAQPVPANRAALEALITP